MADARRNRLYRARAIVLKRMDLGEADRIVTLYTREHGKLRAVAKGVRRTTSRSAGHLEPFAVVDVLLARGRELDVISQAETIEAFRHVREEIDRTSYGYEVAELIDLLTEDRNPSAALFDALVEAYAGLDSVEDLRQAVVRFQLRLLTLLGYRPELSECVVCRATIAPGENQFSAHLGGVLCPACGPREMSARPLDTDTLKLLRNLQRGDGSTAIAAPERISRDAEALLRDYAEQIVERRLRTPALIARVSQAGATSGL